MAFDGFGDDAFAFYRELEANNEKPWWLANKHRYDEAVRAPFEVFSHRKAVLSKPTAVDTLRVIYPPFTELRGRIAKRILG